MTEQKVADMLGKVLKQIQIPAEIVQAIANATHSDKEGDEAKQRGEISKLNQRISALLPGCGRARRLNMDKIRQLFIMNRKDIPYKIAVS